LALPVDGERAAAVVLDAIDAGVLDVVLVAVVLGRAHLAVVAEPPRQRAAGGDAEPTCGTRRSAQIHPSSQQSNPDRGRGSVLTRGGGADVSEEGAELPHLHLLAAGGAEAERLVERRGEDEGLVVPEADGLGDGGVALGEEVLELVHLEEVGDGVVAAVLAVGALPALVAHLLARLLHLGLPRPRREHQRDRAAHQHRRRRQRQRPQDDLVPRPPLHPARRRIGTVGGKLLPSSWIYPGLPGLESGSGVANARAPASSR
jgi:hypothetical protein